MKKSRTADSLMRAVLRGIIAGPCVILAAAAILAFAALKSGNPSGMMFPAAIASVFLGGTAASFAGAKSFAAQPVKAGLLSGLALLGIIFAVALVSSGYNGSAAGRLAPPAAVLLSAPIGTFFASKTKTSSKRRLKKIKRGIK